jgi:hypothetical protein
MKKLKELLEQKVSTMNQDPVKQDLIRKWIDGYRGKVIAFRTDDGEAHHVVFDGSSAEMRKGNYPSCEFSYIGPEDVLCAILSKENTGMRAGMAGAIKGWGSVNEAIKFEALLG